MINGCFVFTFKSQKFCQTDYAVERVPMLLSAKFIIVVSLIEFNFYLLECTN